MQKGSEIDGRFGHLEKKVGLFLAMTVVGLLLVVFFIAREKDLFTRHYTVFFSIESGAGLYEGMAVKLSGFKIGRLKALSLDEEARVRVALDINRKYQKWIRRGSVVRLVKEGVIGESSVEISVGSPKNEVVEDNAELPYEKTAGIEDLANEIRPIIAELREIVGYINAPDGDIKRSIKNISLLTSEIRQTREHIDGILRQTSRETTDTVASVREKVLPVIEDADNLIKKIDGKAGPALDHMEAILSEMEGAAGRLPRIADKVDSVLDDVKKLSADLPAEGPRIREMISASEEVLSDTQETIKGVKGSWPVNRMIPQKEEVSLLPLDGSGGYR